MPLYHDCALYDLLKSVWFVLCARLDCALCNAWKRGKGAAAPLGACLVLVLVCLLY